MCKKRKSYNNKDRGEVKIVISYAPLWRTLKNKRISQYCLIQSYGFSTGTLDALRKNKSVTMNTLNDLCLILKCEISEVVEILPE